MTVPFLFCSAVSCCKIRRQIVTIYTDILLFFIVTIQKKIYLQTTIEFVTKMKYNTIYNVETGGRMKYGISCNSSISFLFLSFAACDIKATLHICSVACFLCKCKQK